MIAPLLALLLSAGPPRVFLSVDRTFLPNQPGTVVRVEVEGTHTLDVRLYQLRDPERFLPGEEGATMPAPVEPAREPPLGSLVAGAAASARRETRAALAPLLTDPAREALRLLAPGALVEAPRDLEFLRGERLVRRWTLPCGGAEAHSYCDVDLGPLPAGAYLVEGVAPGGVAPLTEGRAGYAVALVSSLALVAHRLGGQLLLYATDARTGEPRPGVAVTLTGPGPGGAPAAIQRGSTGPQGTLLLKPSGRRVTVLAHAPALPAGDDWAALSLDYFSARTRGPRAWLSTDRGEIRPGGVVRVLGVQRPAPAQARDAALSLEDGRGMVVAQGLAHQEASGLLWGELTVPEAAAPGLGRVVAELDGREVQGEVWLRSPPRPELQLEASIEGSPSAPVGTSLAQLQVRDGAGRPAPAGLEWRLLRAPLSSSAAAPPGADPGQPEGPPAWEEVASGPARVGPEGELQLPLDLASTGPRGDARFALECAATDAWGRRAAARAEAVRLRGPVHLAVEPDRRVYAPGEAARLLLTAHDAAGHPALAKVTVRARVSRPGPGGEAQPAQLPPQSVELGQTGQAELALPNLQPGYYEVEASAGGPGPAAEAEAVLFVSARGGDIPFTPDALTLVPDKDRYLPGETARVLVFAPFESGHALLTAEAGGELVAREAVAVHGSSALLQVKVGAGVASLTVAAAAVFGGQSFTAARTLPVGGPEPLALQARLEPGKAPGTLELEVWARDASGRPLPSVALLAAYRDAEAEPPLAPPLLEYLEPRPAAEGRTDVSLDFHSAGYSGGPAQARAERARAELAPVEGFTPQKGGPAAAARAPASPLGGLERLPPTDRAGHARATLPSGNAARVAVQLLGAGGGGLAQLQLEAAAPGVRALPELPRVLRPGDHAVAEVRLGAAGPATAQVDGRAVAVAPGAEAVAPAELSPARPELRVASPERGALLARVPVTSGEEWVTAQAGELPPGRAARLAPEAEEGTLRIRAVSGPLGLLQLLAAPVSGPPRAALLEPLHPSPGSPDDADEALARLGLAVARAEAGLHPPHAEAAPAAEGEAGAPTSEGSAALAPGGAASLAAGAAGVLALLANDGGLGAYRGAPYDRARTGLALYLLQLARAQGAAVPGEWLERVRGRLLADVGLARAAPARGLALAALGLAAVTAGAGEPALPEGARATLLRAEAESELGPGEAAALALALALARDPVAASVAADLERRAGLGGGRACWAEGGCDPTGVATAASLADTALAVRALAVLRPRSPRLPGAARHLLLTRNQADWGRGLSGALLPLALASARAALPDRAGAVALWSASGERSAARLSAPGYAVLFAASGPVQLKAEGAPVFYEVAAAHAEPPDAGGELQVTRRYFRLARHGDKLEREPLEGRVEKGAEVYVELTVQGAPEGEVLSVEDRFPGGLEPMEQAAPLGPVAGLVEAGGAVAYRTDRVRLYRAAAAGPVSVGYLARARVAGRFLAPPARAECASFSGRSGQAELEVLP